MKLALSETPKTGFLATRPISHQYENYQKRCGSACAPMQSDQQLCRSLHILHIPLHVVATCIFNIGKVCYKLTGSSDFTLKSLLPVNWQQPLRLILQGSNSSLQLSRTVCVVPGWKHQRQIYLQHHSHVCKLKGYRGVEIVKFSTCPGTSKKPKCTCP